MRSFIAEVVVGQDIVVERVLIALFTGGHLLLQGVPGLAKTLLVSALAKAVNLQFGRVQFTIDLLPADIIGSEILDQASGTFHVNRGPIFTNLLLADEINRASPKVQSALLEAMQERRVTIGRNTLRLPAPFLTIATQNPVEQAGTFELPEAQLDRFMLCHRLHYPDRRQELEIITQSLAWGSPSTRAARCRRPPSTLSATSRWPTWGTSWNYALVQQVYVSRVFTEHCLELVRRTRENRHVDLGCSPRAGIALVTAARAGRSFTAATTSRPTTCSPWPKT